MYLKFIKKICKSIKDKKKCYQPFPSKLKKIRKKNNIKLDSLPYKTNKMSKKDKWDVKQIKSGPQLYFPLRTNATNATQNSANYCSSLTFY